MITLTYLCLTGETSIDSIFQKGKESTKQLAYKAKWLEDGNICIDKEFDVESFDDIGVDWRKLSCVLKDGDSIILNEPVCRALIKESHKAAINTAADFIRDGWLLCDTDPTPGAPQRNKSFLAIKSNREILTEKQKVVADKSSEVAAEFPVIWVKTGKGDADRYSIEVSEIAPMYYAVEFTTQALVNIEIEVQNLIIADFENTVIDLATFEATDYVNMPGGFMDLFATKTADAKVYAQHEESPTAI